MLTIAKSPLRVSFFGGGTDYPEYFSQYPGAVLGATINKYIYIVFLPMVGFAENRFRITYRRVEAVDRIEDIKHNVIRATLLDMGYDKPMNIAIISDLPGGSGLGSSSSFTVGFVKLIEFLRNRNLTKMDLFRRAVYIEHQILKENVGIQDHIHAAFGGFNHYRFHGSAFSIEPVNMTTQARTEFEASLCLVYTNITRSASATLEEQITNTREKKILKELTYLTELCGEAFALLQSDKQDSMLRNFGRLLSEGWEIKRKLSGAISSQQIDEIYETGMRLGAYGGKLCGAGGGGFILFLASESVQVKMAEAFGPKNFVKIGMEESGALVSTVPSFSVL